jgi:hypothetical protein
MGQLGDLFPGAKLRRETPDEAGNGQRFEPGSLDLDGGVIHVRPRPKAAGPADADEPPSESSAD